MSDLERRELEAALAEMRRRLGIGPGREFTAKETLDFVQRPIYLIPPMSQLRGRGRPSKASKYLQDAYERRRRIYWNLEGRPKAGLTAAGNARKVGDRARLFVEQTARDLLAKGKKRYQLRSGILDVSQKQRGAPTLSEDRIGRLLKQLGY